VTADFVEALRTLGPGRFLFALALAVLLTAAVLLAHSLAGWFDNRDS
jgi:hypothetical protein